MRILLVEDEEKVSRFIVRGLQAERFAVDAVFDGDSGLEMASTYTYDLIILDLMLPGMSGTDVLRRIRRANDHVPILVLMMPARVYQPKRSLTCLSVSTVLIKRAHGRWLEPVWDSL
jgi:DNA-binding response OmpR family regulator